VVYQCPNLAPGINGVGNITLASTPWACTHRPLNLHMTEKPTMFCPNTVVCPTVPLSRHEVPNSWLHHCPATFWYYFMEYPLLIDFKGSALVILHPITLFFSLNLISEIILLNYF
jgi:hypothetical protein